MWLPHEQRDEIWLTNSSRIAESLNGEMNGQVVADIAFK